MHLPRTVIRFQVEAPRVEALRLLGIRPHQRPLRASLQRVFEEEYEAARDLFDPAVVLESQQGLAGSGFYDPSMPLALAVCTIGPALDERVEDHTRAGDSARGMVLDAIGSAAVEALADRSNERICRQALEAGLLPDVRSSPGYGRWSLEEQRLIFDLLEPEEIGVSLTGTHMMNPNKSISYAVPLRGGRPGKRARGRCQRCGFRDCEYRVKEGVAG